jgi:hypothetical protein
MSLGREADELIAKLRATLGRVGCDHSCRPRCKVCAARGREKDMKARRERRQGKTYGPAPEGEDVFKGMR